MSRKEHREEQEQTKEADTGDGGDDDDLRGTVMLTGSYEQRAVRLNLCSTPAKRSCGRNSAMRTCPLCPVARSKGQRSLGYGFVEFHDHYTAVRAIKALQVRCCSRAVVCIAIGFHDLACAIHYHIIYQQQRQGKVLKGRALELKFSKPQGQSKDASRRKKTDETISSRPPSTKIIVPRSRYRSPGTARQPSQKGNAVSASRRSGSGLPK